MAAPVTAVCPRCHQDVVVDPMAPVWPAHDVVQADSVGGVMALPCPQNGKPMPFVTGETLQTKGHPVINVPDDHLIDIKTELPGTIVALSYETGGKGGGKARVTFPTLGELEAQIERDKTPPDGAVVVVRFGKGFLAPKVTMLFEFPTIPTFATPEEADEWMEQHAV